MTVNPTLEHTRQVKKIADDLSCLAKEIFHDSLDKRNYQYDNPGYKRISSLGEQLASMHVYLDDILDRMEWQHYVWKRFKKELGIAGWILIGMVLGVAISLLHIIAH